MQPSDTLYSIAWRHNLDYRALARWNGIGADYHISVGQVLELRPTPAPAAAAPSAPPPAVSASASDRWVWPTAMLGSAHAVPGGGVLLDGLLGQPVRAAGSGRVVYLGNGIRGYGNLIIIKHDESFLSAYAHTQQVAVHEGEEVHKGQPIAQMGVGPHQAPALYFEIRLNGKSVDPLPYLSGQK